MRRRFAKVSLVLVVIAGLCGSALDGHTQTKDDGSAAQKKKEPQANTQQLLMRDKLTYAKDALDGLAVEDFAKIVRSGQMMRMISRASSWYVLDSDEYHRFSKNFQEQAADLERHAKDKNLDAAALDYMRFR